MKLATTESRAGGDKREAILGAAWALIRHYGYAKTTIDDIARKAGVGKGTIYLYFRSKTEIMLALTDLTNDRIIARQESIARTDDPPEQRLRACVLYRIMTLFDLVNRYPHSEDVIATILPEIVERLDVYVRRHGELLGQIIAQGCDAKTMRCDHPGATGQHMARLFEFMTPPYYRFDSRDSLERFASDTLDLVLAGLGTSSTVRQ